MDQVGREMEPQFKRPDFADRLTKRQQQIVELVCEGLSNKSIARKLGLSEGTIKSHLHLIYPKIGVGSRTALMIALAIRLRAG
jgi:DNA-binding NarL/FixJ family response regulator